MTTIPITDEMVEAGASAILSSVPEGYGMRPTEARNYTHACLTAALAGGSGDGGKWIAVDERGNDNFATSIYENDYKGLLVARCNQNGQYPWQAASIIRGLERNKSTPPVAAPDAEVK